jgi:cytochrome c556
MRHRNSTRFPARQPIGSLGLAAAALVWLLALAATPDAQRGGGGGGGPAMIPMAASTIVRNPDALYGTTVSMYASVERMLSKTVFSVDQDKNKSTGQEVLVIAPYLTAALEPGSYVTVQGPVFKFDPAEVTKRARGYTLDLSSDLLAQYQGKPAIVATSVITQALVDVAKRVLPPPTPEELALDKAMKTISGTFNDLRAGLEAPKAEDVKTQVATLKGAFTEAAVFFNARKVTDAIDWTQQALKYVGSMEAGAAGAKWDEVKTAATGLAGLCTSCHGVHRERQDDGSFRFRPSGGGN